MNISFTYIIINEGEQHIPYNAKYSGIPPNMTRGQTRSIIMQYVLQKQKDSSIAE